MRVCFFDKSNLPLLLGLCGLSLGVFLLYAPYIADAQIYSGTAVATSFPILESVDDGDIISLDAVASVYRKSTITGDENMFGVVAKDPILSLTEGSQTLLNGDIPILRFGEAVVKVSTLGGPIHAGDYITSSAIAGVGQRANPAEKSYVLGKALQSFSGSGEDGVVGTAAVDGKEVTIGTIPVALRIGQYIPMPSAEGVGNGVGDLKEGQIAIEKGTAVFTVNRLMRYVLAAFIALVTLYIAFRSFKGSMTQSIISVGRNPLAKVSILSMVFLNSLLIIIVSIVALFIGAIIIFAP